MKKIITNLVGRQFAQLTVQTFVGVTAMKMPIWTARCSCGNDVVVRSQELLQGDTRSCGCLHRAAVVARNKSYAKHRAKNKPAYSSWQSMIQRCCNPLSKDYPRWGGRGIKVSPVWRHSYLTFVRDLGERPQGTSLERINVNGDYEPGNCRWATPKQQASNRRSSHIVVFMGKRMTLTQLAESCGVNDATLRQRICKRGMSVEAAATTPVRGAP